MLHISPNNLGKKVTLTPRSPSESKISTPRVCVNQTVAGCFSATNWVDIKAKKHNPIYIYFSNSFDDLMPCNSDVKDGELTNEYWYLSPTEFTLSHVIEVNSRLHKLLVDAAIKCWSKKGVRTSGTDLLTQKKEMAMLNNIFELTRWGIDNIAK